MTIPMTINDPEVIAELRALYPLYEQTLVDNDVEKLIGMFWSGAPVVRFGAAENLYGQDELAAFRKARPPINLARTVTRLDIVSFDRNFAGITLEFERFTDATPPRRIRGRQSQVWVRFPEGWRIVQAHVSVLPPD